MVIIFVNHGGYEYLTMITTEQLISFQIPCFQDYDRDSEILKHLHPFKVLALCSELQTISHRGCSENGFKKLLKELLRVKLPAAN